MKNAPRPFSPLSPSYGILLPLSEPGRVSCAPFLSAHCTGAPWRPRQGAEVLSSPRRCCPQGLQTNDYDELSVSSYGHLEGNNPTHPLALVTPYLLPETHTASVSPLKGLVLNWALSYRCSQVARSLWASGDHSARCSSNSLQAIKVCNPVMMTQD